MKIKNLLLFTISLFLTCNLFADNPKDYFAPRATTVLIYNQKASADAFAKTHGGVLVAFADTGSMLPAITHKTRGVALDIENYKVGDIVVIRDQDGTFIAHRIVEEKDGKFLIKGDNSKEADGWFGPEYIWFKIVALFFD